MRILFFHLKNRFIGVIIFAVFLLTASIGFAWAKTDAKNHFENQWVHENIDLKLKGTALLKYLMFIKAYSGAFYLPDNKLAYQWFDSVPKRLVLEYYVSIEANDLAMATTEMIRKNVDNATFTAIEDRIEQLNRLYRDVKPKDQYALTYIPGLGTKLSLNDHLLGIIKGQDFANAVFSIWLGKNPIDKSFRDKLLGMK